MRRGFSKRFIDHILVGVIAALVLAITFVGTLVIYTTTHMPSIAVTATATPLLGRSLQYADPMGAFSLRYPATWQIYHGGLVVPTGIRRETIFTAPNGASLSITMSAQQLRFSDIADHVTALGGTNYHAGFLLAPVTVAGVQWQRITGDFDNATGAPSDIAGLLASQGKTTYLISLAATKTQFTHDNHAFFIPMLQSLQLSSMNG